MESHVGRFYFLVMPSSTGDCDGKLIEKWQKHTYWELPQPVSPNCRGIWVTEQYMWYLVSPMCPPHTAYSFRSWRYSCCLSLFWIIDPGILFGQLWVSNFIGRFSREASKTLIQILFLVGNAVISKCGYEPLLKKCINVIWINFVTQGNNSYGFLLVPVTALYRYWRWNILENILIELFGPIALVLNFHDSYWLSLFNFWSFLPLMWLKTF